MYPFQVQVTQRISLTGAAGNGQEELPVGTTVAFGLSTTTASGMGISGGLFSQDYDADDTDAVTGGNAITFTTGGATIVVGDVEVSDTVGSVGGTVGGVLDDASDHDTSVAAGFIDDDGLGLGLTTAVGAASLNVSYVSNDDANNFGIVNSSAGTLSVMSASISMPMVLTL